MSLNHKRIEKTVRKWMSLFLLFFMLILNIYAGSLVQEVNKIDWIKSPTTIDAAQLIGKPGMLYFYGGVRTTISPGVRGEVKSDVVKESPRIGLSQQTLSDFEVVALSRKFSCFEFNFVYSPKIVAQYDVTTYPVVIFTDHWGNEVSRCLGNVSAEVLTSFMEIFPEDYSKVLSWSKVLIRDRKNFEALKRMGEFYLKLDAWELSNKYYNQARRTKYARDNEEVLEEIILVVGLNELRMRNYQEAQKLFQGCLDRISDGKERDKSLLGLIIAQLGQGNIVGAERNFMKLKSQFPDSPAVKQAERYIQSVRMLK